jgi:L-lysine 2,3-aminomutase
VPPVVPSLGDTLVRLLRQRGVTVYANIPLLAFINDAGSDMLRLTSALRRKGIELNHLVLAGMPLQRDWSEEHPIHLAQVIDLASHLREFGSGRELPGYILRTSLGEVDFGLSCDVLQTLESGDTPVRLRTHALDEYRAMDPAFEPPPGAVFGDDGHPVASIRGVMA